MTTAAQIGEILSNAGSTNITAGRQLELLSQSFDFAVSLVSAPPGIGQILGVYSKYLQGMTKAIKGIDDKFFTEESKVIMAISCKNLVGNQVFSGLHGTLRDATAPLR